MILSLGYLLNSTAYLFLGFGLGLFLRPVLWRKHRESRSQKEDRIPDTIDEFIERMNRKGRNESGH